ncbi:MAG: NAD(P)-dependent oxidoreductase [Caldilineaceae bacterium]
MKKCLVTGTTGLIGAHLLAAFPSDWQVFAGSRSPNAAYPPLTAISPTRLDLSSNWDATDLPAKLDAVIHLAQSEHFREFPEKALDIFQVNTLSTLRLLDYARQAGARTFVLASSGGVYGHHEQEFVEDEPVAANADLGFYLGTKLCSEILAENYTSFMNVIVLRFFFVYGVGQKRTMLIPRLVQSVLDGRPLTLQGQDGIRINPTHVSDAVTAILRTLDLQGSHKINVGGPEVLSLRRIAEIIGAVVGKEPIFDVHTDGEPRHLVGDIRKMSHLLEAPKISFEQGIRTYIDTTYGKH